MAINVHTARKRLGVHPMTLRKFIETGRLPAKNIAPSHWKRPRWRIEEADLEAFAATYRRWKHTKTTVTE